MTNKIQEKMSEGNLELKLNNFKSKAKNVARAALTTTVAVGFGLGVIYAGSHLLNKSPEELYENVPQITRNVVNEYIVQSGDGYSTIAQNFDDLSTQDIAGAYSDNERAARPGDRIYTDGNEVLVYRNNNLLELNRPSISQSRNIETVVQEQNAVDNSDGFREYIVPENSGYGAWRVARELGVSQDHVLDLLEDSGVMGNDKFILVGDDYLALERNNQRYQIEINKN